MADGLVRFVRSLRSGAPGNLRPTPCYMGVMEETMQLQTVCRQWLNWRLVITGFAGATGVALLIGIPTNVLSKWVLHLDDARAGRRRGITGA